MERGIKAPVDFERLVGREERRLMRLPPGPPLYLRFDRATFRVSSVPATIGWRTAARKLCARSGLQHGDPR